MKKAKRDLVAVIMAGGAGTRFWPLSTRRRPKQFLRLFGERSLLQMSFDRISGIVPPERALVLTNADFVPLVTEQLPQVPPENIIGEPHRRDTAAAVCLAALLVRKRYGEAVVATLTADHLIEPVDLFRETLLAAAGAAEQEGALYTFGIRPWFPATGYGYLELGEELGRAESVLRYRLKRFKEKPDAATAAAYVSSGRFLWNSGMFVWRSDSVLEELARQLPDHFAALSHAVEADGAPQWRSELEKAFRGLQPISVDFGIMEHAADVRCVASTFSWSDVGGWAALSEHLPSDESGNHHRGSITTLDARDNLVFCEEAGDAVALIGVSGLVVVRAGGKTLVAAKERAEDLKRLVKEHDLD